MARGNPRPHGRADRLRGNRRTLAFAVAGLATGAAIKVLDVSTSNAANVFSQLTVWVLVCAAIAVLSESPRRASLSVFLFCAGMLSTYYLAAEALGAPYSLAFAMGWLAFSLLSPLFAHLVWVARAPGALSRLVGAGVVAAAGAATVILFDRIRAWDVIACAATAALLYGGPRRAR